MWKGGGGAATRCQGWAELAGESPRQYLRGAFLSQPWCWQVCVCVYVSGTRHSVARAKTCWAQTCLVWCGPHEPPPGTGSILSQRRVGHRLTLCCSRKSSRPERGGCPGRTGLLPTPSGADCSSPSLKESKPDKAEKPEVHSVLLQSPQDVLHKPILI